MERLVAYTPSIEKNSFACPHCGAYTSQTWYSATGTTLGDANIPNLISLVDKQEILGNRSLDDESRSELVSWIDKVMRGKPIIEKQKGVTVIYGITNVFFSHCFSCREVAIWNYDKLVYPAIKFEITPNPDLSVTVKSIFEEASAIVENSPRGAAALLRLCIQHICIELGEKGRKIDDDIASLVKKGLSPVVQMALDIVRVIGNEAVHPGSIDLNDDREVATKLFSLVNLVADQMISSPKHIAELYSSLPTEKLKGIERRDGN